MYGEPLVSEYESGPTLGAFVPEVVREFWVGFLDEPDAVEIVNRFDCATGFIAGVLGEWEDRECDESDPAA